MAGADVRGRPHQHHADQRDRGLVRPASSPRSRASRPSPAPVPHRAVGPRRRPRRPAGGRHRDRRLGHPGRAGHPARGRNTSTSTSAPPRGSSPAATTRSRRPRSAGGDGFPALQRAYRAQALLQPRGAGAGHHPVAAAERPGGAARPQEPGQGRPGPGPTRPAHTPFRHLLQAHPGVRRLLPRDVGGERRGGHRPDRTDHAHRCGHVRRRRAAGRRADRRHRLPRHRPADPPPRARTRRADPRRGVVGRGDGDVQGHDRARLPEPLLGARGEHRPGPHLRDRLHRGAHRLRARRDPDPAPRRVRRGRATRRRPGPLERRHPAPDAAHRVDAGRVHVLVPRRPRPQPHPVAARHRRVPARGQGVRRGRVRRAASRRPRRDESFDGRASRSPAPASGIGRALAVDLAGRGALLALSDVSPEGLAEPSTW